AAFGPQMVQLSSMQKTASVLMHAFHRLGLANEVLFVDTGFHFHETLRLRDEFMRRYRLNVVTLYPVLTPVQQEEKYERKLHLYVDGKDQCCLERKEIPFKDHMMKFSRPLVVNGLRAAEGGRREGVSALQRDGRINGYTLHPLFDWTDRDVENYLSEHEVPVHPLHAQSYPSIGCACCTTPVQVGEDPRAGRWRHLRAEGDVTPMYCGINFTDGSGI
ncbi:MAG: phosphoadenylyl-sulfate reductase, partial [Planctomycetia bacterium]